MAEVRIHVRISDELKARVKAICGEGVDEAALVRACLEAVADYYDANGEITLPLVMLPRKVAEKLGHAPPKKAGAVKPPTASTGSTRISQVADEARKKITAVLKNEGFLPQDAPRLNEPPKRQKAPVTGTRKAIRDLVAREKSKS